jgi:hypothetical protein
MEKTGSGSFTIACLTSVVLNLLAHPYDSTIEGREQKTQTTYMVSSSGASQFFHMLLLQCNFNRYAVSSSFVIICIRALFHSTYFGNFNT